MITRDELRQIPQLHRQIQRDKEQLLYLREKAASVPSTLTDQERVQTSRDLSGNKYIEAAADLDREITANEERLTDLQNKASIFIDTVEDSLTQKVLEHRYIECERWDEIADIVGYTIRRIRQLEWEALKKL